MAKTTKFLIAFILSLHAVIAEPAKIAEYDGWTAFHVKDKPEYCYVISTLKPVDGKSKKRRFLVTIKEDRGEINYIAGTLLSEKAPASLIVGKKSYPLFCQQDSAWSQNAADDKVIVTSFKTLKNFTVSCESKGRQKIQDVFDLKGFTKAYESAYKVCYGPKKVEKKVGASPKKQ